nr:T9SS type A sorting domain-containing protein [Chitinophagaceae bacterium]
IDFVSGKIVTNNFTLRAPHNLINSGDANSYIATSLQNGTDITTGGFITAVPAGAGTQFPVGTLTSYTPVSVLNTAGANDSITVAVDAAPIITANSNRHLNVTWNLTEKNAGNNTYSLTLFWNTANEGSLFSRSACGLVRSNGSSTITYATGASGATSVLPSFYSRTATGITALSPWSVSSDAAILPIQLLSFSAKPINNSSAEINWQITNSSNPKYFVVERSNDGIVFENVGSVNATLSTEYVYIDKTIAKTGYQFYRLKMMDVEGKITYSKIVKLYINEGGISISNVYPQPLKSGSVYLVVNTPLKTDMRFVVTDLSGKIIATQLSNINKGENTVELKMGHLSKGTYFVTGYSANIKTNTTPIMKF